MQIPLVSAGVLLVLCLSAMMCSAISSLANANTKGGAFQTGGPSAANSTPTETPTLTPTPVPIETSTPSIGGGDHMSLGHDYTQDSNGDFAILSPADHFSAGSELAYVIRLDSAIGTLQVHLLLTKVSSGGSESVVYSVPMNVADPNDNEFANKVSAGTLMSGEPAGMYKLKLSDGSSIRAWAAFRYTG